MIPTTISGIATFLVLLVPGFVFVTLRERHQPSRKLSVLRETSSVMAATAVSYALPAFIAIIVAIYNQAVRTGLASFIGSPTRFAEEHPFQFAAVLISSVGLACVVSILLSLPWMNRFVPSRGGSAWWELFKNQEGVSSTEVTATLKDESVITGTLHSWNRDAEDHSDRDLVIQSPIWLQLPGSEVAHPLDAAALTLSAREIKFLSVRYLKLEDPLDQTGISPTLSSS